MHPVTARATEAPRGAEQQERGERILTWPFLNLMLANGAQRVCMYILIAVIPVYVIHEGMGPTVAGLTTTLFMLAAVAFRPLAGWLTDSRGRFLTLMIGTLSFAVATSSLIMTLPIWLLLTTRFVQGFGFSFTGTAAATVATDIIPERRMSEGIGYLGLEQTLAQIIGPFLGLWLMQSFGYSTAFLVATTFAVIHVAMRIPLRRLLRAGDARMKQRRMAARMAAREAASNGPEQGATRTPWIYRLVDQDAWKPSSLMLLVMISAAAVNTFMAVHVMSHGIADAGWFFVASGLGVGAARVLVGRIEQSAGRAWTIGSGTLMVATALLGILWSPNAGLLIAAGALYGMGLGSVQPSLNAAAVLGARRERRGLANSTFFMAIDGSQAISSFALGLLASAAGVGSVFVAASCALFAAFGLFQLMRVRGIL